MNISNFALEDKFDMAENAKAFREAFRGYNKSDVNAYVASIAEGVKRSLDEAEARVARAERERDDAKGELEIANQKADQIAIEAYAAAQALSEKDAEIAKSAAAVEDAKKQFADAKARAEALEVELLDKDTEIKNVNAKLAAAEKSLTEAREKNFEREKELSAKLIWTEKDFNSKMKANK